MNLQKKLLGLAFGSGLSFLASINSGCAFGDRHADLKYESQRKVQASKNYSCSFEDFSSKLPLKKGKEIIGCVRNGYGWHTADVLAKNSVGEWAKNALITELKNDGYKIVNRDDTTIEGTVSSLFSDLMITYHTNMTLMLEIKKNGKSVYVDTFSAKENPLAWFATASEYGKACEKCLKQVLNQAVPRVEAEIEKLKEK